MEFMPLKEGSRIFLSPQSIFDLIEDEKISLDDILSTHDRWVTQDNATAIAQNEIKTAFPKLKVTRSRLYEF